MTRSLLIVLALLSPASIEAADAEDCWLRLSYALSGEPCSSKTDVRELGGGSWVACMLHQNEVVAPKRWRTWVHVGLRVEE